MCNSLTPRNKHASLRNKQNLTNLRWLSVHKKRGWPQHVMETLHSEVYTRKLKSLNLIKIKNINWTCRDENVMHMDDTQFFLRKRLGMVRAPPAT